MVQLVKQSNSSQPDNFLNILLNQLVRSESLSKRVRACRAQSSQNMRAREQNREHRARGLALKSGLVTNAYNFFPHGDSRHYWYVKKCYFESL